MSEAAAQAAGYAPDPRPARATKSQDGSCPSDNPVKGFTNAQGKQAYLLPNDPGYAGQKATDCFLDEGLAEYYNFGHATGGAPSASPKPSASAVPSTSPKPSTSAAPSSPPANGGSITLSPATLDFGTVSSGAVSSPAKVILTNGSQVPFEVKTLDIRVTGQNATEFGAKFEGCDGQTVGHNGTCTITITFRPTGAPGPRTAQLQISTGAGPSTPTTLKGTAK